MLERVTAAVDIHSSKRVTVLLGPWVAVLEARAKALQTRENIFIRRGKYPTQVPSLVSVTIIPDPIISALA